MALTKVKKVTVTDVTKVVTVHTEGQADLKAKADLKALRREAFIKHKSSGGGDYTRVKKPRYNQKTMYSSDDE